MPADPVPIAAASSQDATQNPGRRLRRCRDCGPRPSYSASRSRRRQRVARNRRACTNRSGPAMIALMQNTLPNIDAEELFRLISLPDALAALRACFAGSPSHVDRVRSRAGGGEFLVMPAAAGDVAGVKLVGIQPANPARGKPIIQGVYVLFDMRIGEPVALLDGAALTTLRTPLISALATDVLARTDARSVGIIGTGPQAAAHVEAMGLVRPAIDKVVVAGRTAGSVAAIVDELRGAG